MLRGSGLYCFLVCHMTPEEALQFERVNFTGMGWVRADPGVLKSFKGCLHLPGRLETGIESQAEHWPGSHFTWACVPLIRKEAQTVL